jgi:hypothetical protein
MTYKFSGFANDIFGKGSMIEEAATAPARANEAMTITAK